MGHGNNQTRSAIPQAAWCQLNRGRIRRLLGLDRMREVVGSQVIFQAVLRDRDSEVRNR